MRRSVFIEGMDGSGKSTQVELLKRYLEEKGNAVLALREPGGSDYYQAIREHIHFAEYDRPPLSDALTCGGGIAQNIILTRQALQEGKWVVSDRAYPSNAIYQIANGLSADIVNQINTIALQGFEYDFKILIDTPIEVAQARLSTIGKKKDRYESLGSNYFKKVRQLYLEFAKANNYFVLSGEETIEHTHQKIIQHLGL